MENQLQIIVRESGLETTKAKYILDKFQDYFEVAAEWEKKAKSLIVTNEKQTAEMEMARVGRLFLREKRIAIEKSRKELKEQALREGKAIDGIANVLKALIVPIEEYLENQEKFVEIQEEKKQEAKRLEIERRMEEERIASEKAEAEERERIRIENEKLKKEAEAREREIVRERKMQEAKLAEQQAKADKDLKEIKEKARVEIEKERLKQEVERKKTEAKVEAERKEKERLADILKNQIECPFCHKKFQLVKRS